MAYEDAGHRPHAKHTGEEPELGIDRGPYGISVTLDTWGPQENLFTTMYDALQSNWGDEPNRSATQRCEDDESGQDSWHRKVLHGDPYSVESNRDDYLRHLTGWCKLTEGQRDYVESCFAGKTLPQILEMLSFEFTVNGVTRAFTHQYVRTRIGAAFMQHGGRDNDWRHRRWTLPETMHRMFLADEEGEHGQPDIGLRHCIEDWDVIDDYLGGRIADEGITTMREAVENYLKRGKELYSALVDAGIPWQDARRVLPIGTQTYIHAIYNYLALQGVCNKRLEFAMDWEINCVAQLMVREVRMKCHPLLGKYLMSLSDKLGIAAYAGLESWTPSGQYDNPFGVCRYCKMKKRDHTFISKSSSSNSTSSSDSGNNSATSSVMPQPHPYDEEDTRPRTHRPEQSPFWVLHPDSMAGGAIKWIPTNGKFPKEW